MTEIDLLTMFTIYNFTVTNKILSHAIALRNCTRSIFILLMFLNKSGDTIGEISREKCKKYIQKGDLEVPIS